MTGTLGVNAAVAKVDLSWQHALDCETAATPCWYDISYPQCGRPFPNDAEFGIVGVNKGIVFKANPCLGERDGQASPRPCNTSAVPGTDTANCAYDYGWNAAADSYQTAAGAYVSLGLAPPGPTRTPSGNLWWLDVEINNSWQSDVTLNVAALEGAVAYLESTNPAGLGFYSNQYQWDQITGGTSVFSSFS